MADEKMIRHLGFFGQSEGLRTSQLDAIKFLLAILVIKIFNITHLTLFGMNVDTENYKNFLFIAFCFSILVSALYLARLFREYINSLQLLIRSNLEIAALQNSETPAVVTPPRTDKITQALETLLGDELEGYMPIRTAVNIIINIIDFLIPIVLISVAAYSLKY